MMLDQKGQNKLKIVYLLDILRKKTDNEHGLTMTEIFDELYMRNITAGRKAIYNDIEMLRTAGFNIEKRRGYTVTYHFIDNDMPASLVRTLALTAAVSPFLVPEEATKLAMTCTRQTTDDNRAAIVASKLRLHSAPRKDMFSAVLKLLEAAAEERKVIFKADGITYRASVYSVYIVDDTPYAIFGSSSSEKSITHMKTTKMEDISITQIKATPTEISNDTGNFDIDSYISSCINPDPDRIYDVEVKVDENTVINFIEAFVGDRLEGDAKTSRCEDGRFTVTLKSRITAQFVRFLYRNSDTVSVIKPECLKEKLSRIEDFTETE